MDSRYLSYCNFLDDSEKVAVFCCHIISEQTSADMFTLTKSWWPAMLYIKLMKQKRFSLFFCHVVCIKTAIVHFIDELFLGSIVVSIPACHAGDQGSIPCRGASFSSSLFPYRCNFLNLTTFPPFYTIWRVFTFPTLIKLPWTTIILFSEMRHVGIFNLGRRRNAFKQLEAIQMTSCNNQIKETIVRFFWHATHVVFFKK